MGRRREYDREFKINAVNLYLKGGKSLRTLAEDLGVPQTTLGGWVKEFSVNEGKSFRGSGKPKAHNDEIYALIRELADVKLERDILKKAVAIFSKAKH